MQLSASTARLLFWTGDRMLRVIAAAGAMALGLVLLLAASGAWREAGVSRAWTSDDAFLDLAVADRVAAGQGYRLDDEAGMPFQANALWRAAVGVFAGASGDTARTAQSLSLLCALGLVGVAFRALHGATGSTVASAVGAAALAASPAFLHLASSPEPVALAALLTALAFDLHFRSLSDTGRPLNVWIALPLGLALLLRAEFAVWWLALALHAALETLVQTRGRERSALCAWNALAGLLLLAVCLWPLVNANVRHHGVPWPALPGAAGALTDGWSALVTDFPRSGPVEFLIGLAGTLALLALPNPRAGARFALLPLGALLVPPLASLGSGLLGAGGDRLVMAAFAPLWLAFGAAGLARAALNLAGKAGPATAAAVGVLLAGLLGFRAMSTVGAETAAREAARVQRERVLAELGLKDAPSDRPVATDQPGWLRHVRHQPVIDLTGRASVSLLRTLTASGTLDPLRTRAALVAANPAGFAVWNPALEPLLDRLDATGAWPHQWQSDEGWPRVRR